MQRSQRTGRRWVGRGSGHELQGLVAVPHGPDQPDAGPGCSSDDSDPGAMPRPRRMDSVVPPNSDVRMGDDPLGWVAYPPQTSSAVAGNPEQTGGAPTQRQDCPDVDYPPAGGPLGDRACVGEADAVRCLSGDNDPHCAVLGCAGTCRHWQWPGQLRNRRAARPDGDAESIGTYKHFDVAIGTATTSRMRDVARENCELQNPKGRHDGAATPTTALDWCD